MKFTLTAVLILALLAVSLAKNSNKGEKGKNRDKKGKGHGKCKKSTKEKTESVSEESSESIPEAVSYPEGLSHFWPLNQKYGGEDLANSNTSLSLHNVTFEQTYAEFPYPATFNATDSYAKLSHGGIQLNSSFSFLLAFNSFRSLGPDDNSHIFQLEDKFSFSTLGLLVDVRGEKFEVYLQFENSCAQFNIIRYLSLPGISPNQWYFFALTVDSDSRKAAIYVNDEQIGEDLTYSCIGHILQPTAFYINGNGFDNLMRGRNVEGVITCVSFWDRAMSYSDMYNSTIPICQDSN